MTNDYKSALIGHTGFVGSNLAQAMPFNEHYNSKNIENIAGKTFDKVVCAGVSAVKWWANQNPEQDKAQIDHLLGYLEKIKTDVFVLISTIDVYREVNGVNEDTDPNPDGLHVYGRHRLYVEEFVKQHFPKYHIIRLPALFGPGLKKNVIYDFMNANGLDVINPKSSFQWYPLRRLPDDMAIIEKADVPLINLAAEPIATGTIKDNYFPSIEIGSNPAPEMHYDMHTKYGHLFGRNSPYVVGQDEILFELFRFIESARSHGE